MYPSETGGKLCSLFGYCPDYKDISTVREYRPSLAFSLKSVTHFNTRIQVIMVIDKVHVNENVMLCHA